MLRFVLVFIIAVGVLVGLLWYSQRGGGSQRVSEFIEADDSGISK